MVMQQTIVCVDADLTREVSENKCERRQFSGEISETSFDELTICSKRSEKYKRGEKKRRKRKWLHDYRFAVPAKILWSHILESRENEEKCKQRGRLKSKQKL